MFNTAEVEAIKKEKRIKATQVMFVLPTWIPQPKRKMCSQVCLARERCFVPSRFSCVSLNCSTMSSLSGDSSDDSPRTPRVSIDYCTGCRWGLRAGWMAQELLQTFGNLLGEVSIRPGDSSGTFKIWLDGQLLWCRKRDGGFPELKVVKQRIRDVINPQMPLGHSDKPSSDTSL